MLVVRQAVVGPFAENTWLVADDATGAVGLVHTRLSIIGLDNGSQPMASPDGAAHMVVNGEFYGYREIRERLRASGASRASSRPTGSASSGSSASRSCSAAVPRAISSP
mgnify:CR=1 FL=1